MWLNMDVFVLLGIDLFSQLHSEVSKTLFFLFILVTWLQQKGRNVVWIIEALARFLLENVDEGMDGWTNEQSDDSMKGYINATVKVKGILPQASYKFGDIKCIWTQCS